LGCQGFLPKYDLSEAKCGDYGKNPKGTDLYCPKRWYVLAALSLLDFLFFVGKYYTQKVLVVFLFLEFIFAFDFVFVFESFWKKKPFVT